MPDKAPRQIPSAVVTLGWISFLTDVASEMIYPLLPTFLTRTLKAGPAAVGIVEGVAEATASVTKILSGWWSDRVRKRKPLVVLGYSIAAVARPLVAFAFSWTQVLAIRFADRVGKGIRTPPRDALLADLIPPERRGRAFGFQRAMDNAGALVGPLIAAFLLKYVVEDPRTVFLLAFVPGLAAVVLLLVKVREAAPAPPPPSPEISNPKAEIRDPKSERLPPSFKSVVAIFVLFTLANSTDAFLLLRAREAGLELWQLPLVWSLFHAVKAAAGVPGGALGDRIGHVPAIALGWAVYALSYLGFAYLAGPSSIWGLFAFYALHSALTEGPERALIAGLVPARSRGRAFGLFHAGLGLAALPASILFGIWWTLFGARAAFAIGAGIAASALAALLLWNARRRRAEAA